MKEEASHHQGWQTFVVLQHFRCDFFAFGGVHKWGYPQMDGF